MAQINETAPDLPVTVSEPVRNLVFACLAKDPAERPASAAHLARAATALRRGDVAAAAASVPAVLGGNTPTAATMLMPGVGNDDATTVLPLSIPGTRASAAAAAAAEDEEKKRKRSPWTWPLIVLIALLVLVLGGTVVALVNQNSPQPAPSSSPPASHSETPSVRPSATTTTPPAPTTVQVTIAEFTGLTSAEARAKLESMDLVANIQIGKAAETSDQVDHVYDVNPTGPVTLKQTITVTVYGPVATPDTPTSGPSATPTSVASGDSVDVSWPAATCPTGQTISGYEVQVDGGATITSANPTQDTTATVTAGSTDFTIKYRYFCGPVASDFSPATTVTVTTSVTPPTVPPKKP